jgi:hypothetical protein
MQFMRANRVILVFAAIAVVLGGLEIAGHVHKDETATTDHMGLSSESELILKLYPDSPEADYIRGVQAKHLRLNLQEARQHFETGLAKGIKSHSFLLHEYAVILHLQGADETEVAAAVATWNKNAPGSMMPSPQTFARPFPEWNRAASLRVMALAPGGGLLAQVLETGAVAWVNLETGEKQSFVPTNSLPLDHLLNVSRDQRFVLAADSAGGAAIIDAATRTIRHQLRTESVATSGAFSHDGKLCAIGGSDGSLRL